MYRLLTLMEPHTPSSGSRSSTPETSPASTPPPCSLPGCSLLCLFIRVWLGWVNLGYDQSSNVWLLAVQSRYEYHIKVTMFIMIFHAVTNLSSNDDYEVTQGYFVYSSYRQYLYLISTVTIAEVT